MKFIKGFFVLLVISIIIFGLQAISYESSIFAQEQVIWCENGGCEALPYMSVKCTHTASYVPKSLCQTIQATCKTCVDYTYSNCLCTSGSEWCIKADGSYYYGSWVECDIDK